MQLVEECPRFLLSFLDTLAYHFVTFRLPLNRITKQEEKNFKVIKEMLITMGDSED